MTHNTKEFEPPFSDCHWSLLLSSPARGGSSFYGGESMKQSWVEHSQGSYVVKTGTRTPFGFVGVKKMDRFQSLTEANKKADTANYIWGKIAKISATLVLTLFMCTSVFAYTEENLAEAIRKTENSVKYPYGVKSINTKGNVALAHNICLNSIRNAKKRHIKTGMPGDFVSFMGLRYSPPNINPNWVRLVHYFLGE